MPKAWAPVTSVISGLLTIGLGNPVASRLKPEQFVDCRYRQRQTGLSSNTFNNHRNYLSAFYQVEKSGVINYANPIEED
ncbi:MAG: phage integrase [Gammaproteobacteria bacterium]